LKKNIAEITSKSEIMPGTFLITLHSSANLATAVPGQFVMADCGPDYFLRRPFSIHNIINNEPSLLIRKTGKGTSHLTDFQKGDNLNILLPLGNGFTIEPASKNLLLIAGGIGVAPLIFLASVAGKMGKKVTLIMGAASARYIYPQALLPDNIDFVVATEDGSLGKKALVTEIVADYLAKTDQVFACGPLNMYQTLADTIKSAKFNKTTQVSLEVRMGCGFGICYGCTIKTRSGTKQVCTHGPIFNINELDWDSIKL
jgi:dihydroorotate dehydrogenase electron transfer subunit